jgi:hypothetical protein
VNDDLYGGQRSCPSIVEVIVVAHGFGSLFALAFGLIASEARVSSAGVVAAGTIVASKASASVTLVTPIVGSFVVVEAVSVVLLPLSSSIVAPIFKSPVCPFLPLAAFVLSGTSEVVVGPVLVVVGSSLSAFARYFGFGVLDPYHAFAHPRPIELIDGLGSLIKSAHLYETEGVAGFGSFDEEVVDIAFLLEEAAESRV